MSKKESVCFIARELGEGEEKRVSAQKSAERVGVKGRRAHGMGLFAARQISRGGGQGRGAVVVLGKKGFGLVGLFLCTA